MFLVKFLNNIKLTFKICLIVFLSLSFTYSQQITIRDSETNEILSDVAVFNESRDKSTLSDINGNANLDLFSTETKLYFQILGYSLLEILVKDIENGSTILLYPEDQNLDEVILSVARLSLIHI